MKIHVLYDKSGSIISAGPPMPSTAGAKGPQCGPIPKGHQLAAEFEVPEEFANVAPQDLGPKLIGLEVDTTKAQHRLIVKRR